MFLKVSKLHTQRPQTQEPAFTCMHTHTHTHSGTLAHTRTHSHSHSRTHLHTHSRRSRHSRSCRCSKSASGRAPSRLSTPSASTQVRIHFIIVMIRWTGLAPWEFEFPRRPFQRRQHPPYPEHVTVVFRQALNTTRWTNHGIP